MTLNVEEIGRLRDRVARRRTKDKDEFEASWSWLAVDELEILLDMAEERNRLVDVIAQLADIDFKAHVMHVLGKSKPLHSLTG